MLLDYSPGSAVGGQTREEAIGRITAAINLAHDETNFVTIVLENMAGQGNVIGNKFEDLRDIIYGIEDKGRIGVCLDTCHMFAAGETKCYFLLTNSLGRCSHAKRLRHKNRRCLSRGH